jgi:hypothetical protein
VGHRAAIFGLDLQVIQLSSLSRLGRQFLSKSHLKLMPDLLLRKLLWRRFTVAQEKKDPQ